MYVRGEESLLHKAQINQKESGCVAGRQPRKHLFGRNDRDNRDNGPGLSPGQSVPVYRYGSPSWSRYGHPSLVNAINGNGQAAMRKFMMYVVTSITRFSNVERAPGFHHVTLKRARTFRRLLRRKRCTEESKLTRPFSRLYPGPRPQRSI